MLAQIDAHGALDRRAAACYLRLHYGDRFAYENEDGDIEIARSVMAAFAKLCKGRVVWLRGKDQGQWRQRQ
jgi:hypothetical protein